MSSSTNYLKELLKIGTTTARDVHWEDEERHDNAFFQFTANCFAVKASSYLCLSMALKS